MDSEFQNGKREPSHPDPHPDVHQISHPEQSQNRLERQFNGGDPAAPRTKSTLRNLRPDVLPTSPLSLWLALGAFTATLKSGFLSQYGPAAFWSLIALTSVAVVTLLYRSRETVLGNKVDAYKVVAATRTRIPWFKILAPLVALVAADIGLDSSSLALHVSPHLVVALKFLAVTSAIAYSGIQLERSALREGPKRAREIARSGLEGLTPSRLEVMDSHRSFANSLVQLNAIDGVRIQARLVARATNLSVEEVLLEARELNDEGLARIAVLMNPEEPDKWLIELTEDGVKALAARNR